MISFNLQNDITFTLDVKKIKAEYRNSITCHLGKEKKLTKISFHTKHPF